MKKKRPALLLILLGIVIMYRLYFGVISIETAGLYHIGYIPWSDAKGWLDGAESILQGGKLSGLPARRPLFTLFLSILLIVCGGAYQAISVAQAVLFLMVFILSWYIAKDIHNRLSVITFMSFLTVWHIDSQSLLMTENLGICLLILSFCLIWSGLSVNSFSRTILGFFFLGLSQAIRPWAVFILMTTPFLSFFNNALWKRKIQMFTVYVLMTGIGLSFHTIAWKIYNNEGTASNFAHTFYGQVCGGKGWKAVFNDPIYLKYQNENPSEKELNQIIYKRSIEILFKDPSGMVKATIESYKNYFYSLMPKAFEKDYWHLFLLICFIVFTHKKADADSLIQFKKKWYVIVLFLLLIVYDYKWFWMAIFFVGLTQLRSSSNKPINMFIMLYFLGILLSLPLVGKDGGDRVCIASDILLYVIASFGFSFIVSGHQKEDASTSHQLISMNKKEILNGVSIPLGMMVLLIASPMFVMGYNTDDARTGQMPHIDGLEISKSLNMDVIPSSIGSLGYWLDPSYDRNQGRWVYTTFQFDYRNTFFLSKDDEVIEYNIYFWPMVRNKPAMDRTFLVYPWVVFLNTYPHQLKQFDKREIIVVGTFYPRPKKEQYYDTQTRWIIVAKKIGYLNNDSKITWETIPPSK
ncbi:MAG: hypothetical protein KJ737_01625 [Proteobacteria bacterium]|nr:hypothetical protein [Pseudomonadota bacterium]